MRSSFVSLCFYIAVSAVAVSATGCGDAATTADSSRDIAGASDFSVYTLSSSWTNQHGEAVKLADLSGSLRVVAMVYTNCHSTCPLIVAEMKRIEAAIPATRKMHVGYVLVSLDPTRDIPERLAEWATSIELDPASWTVLTSTEAAVRELAATFEVRYQQQQNDELAHTNGLTVLDGDGRIVHQQVRLGESAETIRVINSLLK